MLPWPPRCIKDDDQRIPEETGRSWTPHKPALLRIHTREDGDIVIEEANDFFLGIPVVSRQRSVPDEVGRLFALPLGWLEIIEDWRGTDGCPHYEANQKHSQHE